MRFSSLLVYMLCCTAAIQAQVPADAISLEDAAFNDVFASRGIPTVTGKLLNGTPEELKGFTISYSLVTPFSTGHSKRTASLQPDGSFSLKLDYPFPYQQIWFSIGELFYCALYAHKDLHVELDLQKLRAAKPRITFNGDGIRFLGTDSTLNSYMNNYILYQRRAQLRLSKKIYQLLDKQSADFSSIQAEYDQLQDSLKVIEDSYIAANPSPYSFLLENERLSEYYGNICVKYWGKKMDETNWQKIKQHKSYLVSNNSSLLFYNYLATYIHAQVVSGAGWEDVAALPDLTAYEQAMVDSLRTWQKNKPVNPDPDEQFNKWEKPLLPRIKKIVFLRSLATKIALVDSLFPPAKADFLKLRLNISNDITDQQLAMEYFLKSMHTSWSMAVMKKEYKRISDKVEEVNKTLAGSTENTQPGGFGQPLLKTPFGASMYKATDIKGKDFLAALKQSFPGKAIIIDLWATWCGPCVAEMPHSKKLLEASTDLPVVFVYLCTVKGSDENKWKSKVAELKQPGIHIFIDVKLDTELANIFSFTGYPGYAFIDKTGRYKPGFVNRISEIKDRNALAELINK